MGISPYLRDSHRALSLADGVGMAVVAAGLCTRLAQAVWAPGLVHAASGWRHHAAPPVESA